MQLEKLDDIDLKILSIMQSDARVPMSKLAKQVGLSPPSVHERIFKLKERGIIDGYVTVLDAKKLGKSLTAFIGMTLDRTCCKDEDVINTLKMIPEVQEVHRIAGEEDFLLKVKTEDTSALEKMLINEVARIKGVAKTRTMIALSSPMERMSINLSKLQKS
jgi:Lrp/AsnC family leucine-responsive transcriptional regulator